VILLTSAVAEELSFFQARDGIETLVTGVGPVEASCAIATALCRRTYRLVINAGLAGSFDGAVQLGEGVVVAEDAMELGLEDGTALSLPRDETAIDRSRSDPNLVARLRAKGYAVVRGITVSRVTSTDSTARRLADRGAQVESMEGFAALRAAEIAGIPAIELRGISNRCGARDSSQWNFAAGLAGLQRITDALFELL
jgi:futalosine hydrolase